MPTYDYLCTACDHKFEEFQSMSASPLRKCPKCGKSKLKRLIGIGAGIIFKGSGFYETDYRSESYKKAEKADQGPAAPAADGKSDAKSDGKSESKTETKTETKVEAKSESKSETKSESKPAPKSESKPAPSKGDSGGGSKGKGSSKSK